MSSFRAHGDDKEFFEVAAEALNYLVNEIRTLKEDNDIILQVEKELLMEDLGEEAQRIEAIAKKFEKIYSAQRNPKDIVEEGKIENEIINKYRPLLCQALSLYYHDLDETKKKIMVRLGLRTSSASSSTRNNGYYDDDSSFRLKNLDELMVRVKKHKEILCDNVHRP